MFKKQDLIIIGVIAALAILAFIAVNISGSAPPTTVEVAVNGTVVATYLISDDGEYDVAGYRADGSGASDAGSGGSGVSGAGSDGSGASGAGTVHFTISNGAVDVTHADCPNQICVHHSPITRTGESIVCLPNRVVITLRGRAARVDATM